MDDNYFSAIVVFFFFTILAKMGFEGYNKGLGSCMPIWDCCLSLKNCIRLKQSMAENITYTEQIQFSQFFFKLPIFSNLTTLRCLDFNSQNSHIASPILNTECKCIHTCGLLFSSQERKKERQR
uniref:Uncharacterized protein n=1 Tax=Micrurus spixii TaxID=129469 RepID=A0A2D4ML42_9SAUR